MAFFLAAALICGHLAGPNSFVKTITGSNGIFSLQTASHHLTAPGKPDVWLVGVAHIGDKGYYTDIQKLLDAQGAVLFEGVKPKAGAKADPPKLTKATDKPAKPIYQVLSDALGLDFQLADINYNHPNWVDSDLSMDELEKLNSKESKGGSTQFNTISKLLDPNSDMAKQFSSAIQMMTPGMLEGVKMGLIKKLSTLDPSQAMFDPTTMDVVMKARNESVENYFAKTIGGTAPPKSVAIFYGALHQDSLEHSLISKYGYKVTEERWFTAATADTNKLDGPGKMILDQIENAFGPPAAAGKKS